MTALRSDRRRSPLRVLCGAVVNLLLVSVTLAGVAYLVPSLLGYERYVITGGSMAGSIEKGSLVFARPVPVEELAVDDVITYLPPADSGVTTLVTHRIVSSRTSTDGTVVFRTKGDANADPDPWKFSLTGPNQAVVSFSVPGAGYAFIALADRETRMLLVGLPATLVALISLFRLGQAIRPHRVRAPQPFAV